MNGVAFLLPRYDPVINEWPWQYMLTIFMVCKDGIYRRSLSKEVSKHQLEILEQACKTIMKYSNGWYHYEDNKFCVQFYSVQNWPKKPAVEVPPSKEIKELWKLLNRVINDS